MMTVTAFRIGIMSFGTPCVFIWPACEIKLLFAWSKQREAMQKAALISISWLVESTIIDRAVCII